MARRLPASTGLPRPDGVVDRRRFIPERAKGKAVVHLGCVDEWLTAERAGTGDLLHEEVAAVASELVGVDISAAGLRELEGLVPGRYVQGDVERLGDVELPNRCDLVLAPELIEHLGSPARFLAGLRDYLERSGASAIISTPNAYSWHHAVRFALLKREWVHPDHRCLFSPTTLRMSCEEAGLTITGFWVHAWERGGRPGPRSLLDWAVLRWNPMLAVGLIVEVEPARHA